MFTFLIMILTLTATVTPKPGTYIVSDGLWSSPFTSAAYLGAATAPLITSVGPIASIGPVASIAAPITSVAAPVASIAPVAQVASVAPVASAPVTSYSDYRYGYGSSVSYQDYYPVNSALSLPYSLPYAYAADWYYRK